MATNNEEVISKYKVKPWPYEEDKISDEIYQLLEAQNKEPLKDPILIEERNDKLEEIMKGEGLWQWYISFIWLMDGMKAKELYEVLQKKFNWKHEKIEDSVIWERSGEDEGRAVWWMIWKWAVYEELTWQKMFDVMVLYKPELVSRVTSYVERYSKEPFIYWYRIYTAPIIQVMGIDDVRTLIRQLLNERWIEVLIPTEKVNQKEYKWTDVTTAMIHFFDAWLWCLDGTSIQTVEALMHALDNSWTSFVKDHVEVLMRNIDLD